MPATSDDPALPIDPFGGFSNTSLEMPARGDTITMNFLPLGLEFEAPTLLKLVAEDAQLDDAYFLASVEFYDPETGAADLYVGRVSTPTAGAGPYTLWRVTRIDDGGPIAARIAFSATANVLEAGVKTFDIQANKAFILGDRLLVHPKGSRQHADATVIDYTADQLIVKFKAAEIHGTIPISVDTVDAIAAGGTGYNRGETITLSGGTFSAAAILTVTNVDEDTGAVTEVEITNAGEYSVFPSDSVAQDSTSGSGAGATFNLTPSNEHDDWQFELIDRAPPGIPLYQLNGLRVTINGSDPDHDIDISKGSVRDSTDTVDLVLDTAITKRLDAAFAVGTNQGAQVQSANLAGTVSSSALNVTGTGTAFATDFCDLGDAFLADYNDQAGADGEIFGTTLIASGAVVTAVDAMGNNTALTTFSNLSASGATYKRGGYTAEDLFALSSNLVPGQHYGILIVRKDSDGTVDVAACCLTASGEPDLPSGYTYYRIIAIVIINAGVLGASDPLQPLIGQSIPDADEIDQDNSNGLGATVQAALDTLATRVAVLDSDTFSGASTVDIFFPAGYTAFQKLVLDFKFTVGTDAAELFARLSTAASFLSGASDYRWWHETRPSNTGTATLTADGADSEIELCLNVEATNGGGSLTIVIRNPTSTVDRPTIETTGRFVNSTTNTVVQNLLAFGEFTAAAQDTDGIQLLPSTGTISGSWTLTGYP